MAKKKEDQEEELENYFIKDKKVEFTPSGCTLLDRIHGNGYPLGRVVNIVGDKSTNKTGLSIEACANFILKFNDGKVYYHETESAFDKDYAQELGMPIDRIEFIDEYENNDGTIEFFFETISAIIKKHEKIKLPGLYIIDSFDALSDRAEKGRKIDEGSYGMNKGKVMSQIFRRIISDINRTNLCLLIISQVRYNVNAGPYGEKYTRAGGKALDMYASVITWLSELKKIKKEKKGIERVTGIWVKAKNKKNKVGFPFRECEFPVVLNYGIHDIWANLEWLASVNGGLDDFGITKKEIKDFMENLIETNDKETIKKIEEKVITLWDEIENSFLPKIKKYS